jgi:hypothetical protein
VIEQVGQGDKADLTAAAVIQGDRQDDRVEERDVVGGQQDPAVDRDPLGADHPQVGQQPHPQPRQRRQEVVEALGSPPATCRCHQAIILAGPP